MSKKFRYGDGYPHRDEEFSDPFGFLRSFWLWFVIIVILIALGL